MATVFSTPKEIKLPNSQLDRASIKMAEENFLESLRTFCKKNSDCPDAGKEISFPIADGKARYMVLSYTQLIHIPLWDAYQIPAAHARGLKKDDIIRQIKSEEMIQSLFSRKNNASGLQVVPVS